MLTFSIVTITAIKFFLAFINRKNIGFDEYWHLILIRDIKDNGLYNSAEHSRFIRPSTFTIYPWFFHWLLSMLPSQFEKQFGYLVNPILDVLFMLGLYSFMATFEVDQVGAVSICLMYAFSPMMFSSISMGPRITSLTPRLFGEVVGIFYFLYLYLYSVDQSVVWGSLSLLCGVIVVLSSKFSIQAIIFISVIAGICLGDFVVIVMPFAAICSSLIVTKLNNKEALTGQIQHLTNYAKQNMKGKMAVSGRASFIPFLIAIKNRDLNKLINLLISRHPFTSVLIKLPHVFLALFLVLPSESLSTIDVFFLAGFSVYILTSTQFFLFLGEAERYLIYVSPFAYLIVWENIFSANAELLWGAVIYGFIYIILEAIFFIKKSKVTGEVELANNALINEISQYTTPLNIATIPYHLGGWRIIYDTNHNHLHHTWWNNKVDIAKINQFTLKYPFLDVNQIKAIKETYSIDKFFILKNALPDDLPKGICLSPLEENTNVIEIIV